MTKTKKALITGITGQDGAFLAEFLLNKGYKVYGTFRRVSIPNFYRLKYLNILDKVEMVPFDLLDQSSILQALQIAKPDEIYNLAAQSYVGASFEQAVATGEITGLGVTRILDAVRVICPEAKFYQASSSEMYGNVEQSPQSESTPFQPASPYAAAKVYAHWVTANYRNAYGLFCCSGILFNHESPLRGIEFVTRKITYTAARIKAGLENNIQLGNIEAKRDWGYAPDYVKCMWKMLQQSQPDDYVVATGVNHSVKEFLELAFEKLDLKWEDYLEVLEELYRPTDVNTLLGNPKKAMEKLGWDPKRTTFEELVEIMVQSDYDRVLKGHEEFVTIKEIPHFKE